MNSKEKALADTAQVKKRPIIRRKDAKTAVWVGVATTVVNLAIEVLKVILHR